MARIADAEIDRLKSDVSLVRLIEGAGYTLKPQGKDLAMRCPFHADDETPSFIVTPAKNVWHCFGCQTGGSVVDWVMAARKVSFRHAVELLRNEHPSLFTAPAPQVRPAARPAADLASAAEVATGVSDAGLLTSVIAHYHATLPQAPEALAYLEARGLTHPELIDVFQLGFANRTLGYRLPRSDYRAGAPIRAQLQRLGILRESGHEHFNGSLVVPVFDAAGNVAEMYGRKVRTVGMPAATPKHLYLPGPHRGVFNQSGWQGSIEVILCEALIDALTFWCAGYRHVTSAFGVSGFTDELLAALVANGTQRVLIAYDCDEAGDTSAAKLAPILAQHGMAPYRVLFPKSMDANEYALKVGPPEKALGVALRSAQAMDVCKPPLATRTDDDAHESNGHGRGGFALAGEAVAAVADGDTAQGILEYDPERGCDDADAAVIACGAGRFASDGDGVRTDLRPVPGLAVPSGNGGRLGSVAGSNGDGIARGSRIDMGGDGAGAAPPQAQGVEGAVLPLAAEPCSPEPVIEVRAHDVIAAFGPRRYRVRGLEKNLSFEVLKVNVQVSAGERLHVDTLDLYQAKARAGFVKQAGIELGVTEAVIGRDVIALLRALEPMQEAAIAQTLKPAVPALPALSAEEETAALALLRDPALVERIVADAQALGVVGEGANVLMGYLACVSRKLDKPLAILIQSTSAAGKSTLMDALLSLVPEAERVHYSAMTGQSLFYLGEGDLKHKILAIAEEEGVRQAAYALKLLQSQGELTIASTGKDPATGKLVTEEYRVEGPVMLFLTTTAIDIDEELLNRCLVLTIDESREQTAAIQARQRAGRTLDGLLAGRTGEAVRRTHRAAQTLLRPLAVVNPYAHALTFRSESTRLRRDHAKYLTLIDAIALLHQHQRSIKTVEHGGAIVEYVEVTLDDIALANRLAHEVLGRSLDELPPQTRRVLSELDTLVRERMGTQALARSDVRVTRREVRAATGLRDTQVRVHLERLVELDYLLPHAGCNGQRYSYEVVFDGDAASNAAQAIGLADVATLTTLPTSRPESATSRGAKADLAGSLRVACGNLAASSRGEENPRNASADAALSLVAALDLPAVLLEPRNTKPVVVNGSRTASGEH